MRRATGNAGADKQLSGDRMGLIGEGGTEYTMGPTVRWHLQERCGSDGVFGGRSSVVERQLPKLYVEGSIPFARSKKRQHSQ
jgi:hypothetical protein